MTSSSRSEVESHWTAVGRCRQSGQFLMFERIFTTTKRSLKGSGGQVSSSCIWIVDQLLSGPWCGWCDPENTWKHHHEVTGTKLRWEALQKSGRWLTWHQWRTWLLRHTAADSKGLITCSAPLRCHSMNSELYKQVYSLIRGQRSAPEPVGVIMWPLSAVVTFTRLPTLKCCWASETHGELCSLLLITINNQSADYCVYQAGNILK